MGVLHNACDLNNCRDSHRQKLLRRLLSVAEARNASQALRSGLGRKSSYYARQAKAAERAIRRSREGQSLAEEGA